MYLHIHICTHRCMHKQCTSYYNFIFSTMNKERWDARGLREIFYIYVCTYRQCTHTYSYIYIQQCTHTYMYKHTFIYILTMHTHVHAHTHTSNRWTFECTNTYTHIHMMMITFSILKSSLVSWIEGLCTEIIFTLENFDSSVSSSHFVRFFFGRENVFKNTSG